MSTRNSLISGVVAGFTFAMTVFIGSANAAVVPVCTAASGCTPDIDAGGTATFTSNGAGGQLVLTGNTGNIGFKIDEVLAFDGSAFDASDDNVAGDTSNQVGQLGFSIIHGSYTITLDVDSNGDAIGGSIEVGDNASIASVSWVRDNISAGAIFTSAVQTLGGVELRASADGDTDAYLAGTASSESFGGIGFSVGGGINIGFAGGDVTGGLLAEYSSAWAVSGLTDSISGINANNYLTTSWSAALNGPLDIVVPVPAAWMFYASACAAFGVIRSKKTKSLS